MPVGRAVFAARPYATRHNHSAILAMTSPDAAERL
jgi:hypothetical protein